jgi:hypothetical protein
LFILTFWKSLIGKLRVYYKILTLFYPQTNGQTERVNQIVEQYIRCFTNYGQTNWVKLLPIAQFVYNSVLYEVTKTVLFKAVLGYIPQAYYEPILGQKNTYYIQVDSELIKHTIRQMLLNI